MKTVTQNHNHVLKCQMPDVIRDTYDFDENHVEDYYSSPAVYPNE